MAPIGKRAAGYDAGLEARHCGPSRKWPDGANPKKCCKHFRLRRVPYAVGLCVKVEGRISPPDGCTLWEPKEP